MKFKFPKTIGGWISLGLKVGGGLLVASPMIQAIADVAPGGPGAQTTPLNTLGYFPTRVLFYYTGFDSNHSYAWNPAVGTGGIASVAGGLALIKLGPILGKMIH